MTGLTYFTVTADYLPSTDRGTLWGTVQFTMMVQSGSTLAVPSLDIISVPVTVPATLGRGVLCDATGTPGVDLLANTPALNLTGTLYYQVTFTEVWYQAPGQKPVEVPLNSFTFAAPTSATTIDLSTVTPAAGVVAQQVAAVANGDGTMSVAGVAALQPLSATTIITTSSAPAIGQTTYYNAASGNLTPTLPALSGLSVGARLAVRRDPADTAYYNTVTLSCAGSDIFYSSGATSTSFPLFGEQREFQVITVSGVKYWAPEGSINPVAALDNRYLAGASKLAVIADNGFGTSLAANATSTVGTSELTYTVGVGATNITAQWDHWYTAGTTPIADTDPSGPISFNASLRVVSSSNPGTVTNQIYRLTFGGRITATLDPGGRVVAEPVGVSLMPGDVVAIRTYLISGTAYAPWLNFGVLGQPGGFTASSDLTAPGSAAISNSNGYLYGPSAVLGYPDNANSAKSVLLLGDSIAKGTGDVAVITTPAIGGIGGFAERALTGKAGLLSVAMSGDLASWFQSTNGSFRRLSNARLCNSAIIEYGTNDLVTGGETAAAIEAIQLNLATNLRRTGIGKVFLTTLIPRTTSTDAWATTIHQTVMGSEPQRLLYNAWVRAGCPIDPTALTAVAVGTAGALRAGSFGHPITGFFDTAASVESSLNSGFWLASNRVVTDGAITSGSTSLTSATANFQSANQEAGGDKGTEIIVFGAGAAGTVLTVEAQTVSNSTTVLLNGAAGTTVTNAQVNIGVMTLDGTHPSPHGHYLMSQAINTAML